MSECQTETDRHAFVVREDAGSQPDADLVVLLLSYD